MSWKTAAIQAVSTPLHVYNRGVNGEPIFRDTRDYEYWMELLAQAITRYEVDLLFFALMPNHYHKGVIQRLAYEVSGFIGQICARYARYYNKKYRRYGPVFQGRFVPKIVLDDAGLLRLSHYIHTNPVAAHLSPTPESWPYSSCAAYMNSGQPSLIQREVILRLVGGSEEYRKFLTEYDPSDPLSTHRFLKNGGAML